MGLPASFSTEGPRVLRDPHTRPGLFGTGLGPADSHSQFTKLGAGTHGDQSPAPQEGSGEGLPGTSFPTGRGFWSSLVAPDLRPTLLQRLLSSRDIDSSVSVASRGPSTRTAVTGVRSALIQPTSI